MYVGSLYTSCFVMFCVFLYMPLCHGTINLTCPYCKQHFFFEHLFHLYSHAHQHIIVCYYIAARRVRWRHCHWTSYNRGCYTPMQVMLNEDFTFYQINWERQTIYMHDFVSTFLAVDIRLNIYCEK